MGWSRQLVKAALSACLPPERWLVRGPRTRCADRPTIALTFDDGPHPEHTPAVLDALREWGQTATFFVVGREAARHPELLQRIAAEGHTLGNHTYTHAEPRTLSAEAWGRELQETDRELARWTGAPSPFVRPPKGELTWAKWRTTWRTRQTIVLWNVDPRDYRMTTAAEARDWAERYAPRPGDIVLLHDHRAAAAEIVRALGRRGVFDQWRSVGLSAWLGGAPQRAAGAHSST